MGSHFLSPQKNSKSHLNFVFFANLIDFTKINKLKNSDKLSRICKKSKTPIVIIKNGFSDVVIMSVELYEEIIAKIQVAFLINKATYDPTKNDGNIGLNSFIKEIIN